MADSPDYVVVDNVHLEGFDPEGKKPEDPETVAQVKSWLRPTQYDNDSSELNKHLKSRTPGTGSWLRETPEYSEWRSSGNLLLIDGIPGSGKSVIAASLVEELAKTEPVVYFFFRNIIESNRTAESLVRDWLHQLIAVHPPLTRELEKEIGEECPFHVLWAILEKTVSQIRRLYCVVDALDEMEHEENFWSQLIALSKISSVRVMATSRRSRPLEKLDCARIHIGKVDQDITLFLENRLCTIAAHVRVKVIDTIRKRGDGLFLYARLMADDVLQSTDPLSRLEGLPHGLSKMYTAILQDHVQRSGLSKKLQVLILQWVTHSARPLRLLELATILCMYETFDLLKAKDKVRQICGPLLEVLGDETVQIIHHSFTEYLRNNEEYAGAYLRIATACLEYLSSDDFNKPFGADTYVSEDMGCILTDGGRTQLLSERYQKYPLLQYASDFWPHHANEPDQKLFRTIDEFLNSPHFDSWFKTIWWPTHGYCDTPSFTPLHVAAYFGLYYYAQYLNANVREVNNRGRDAISYASERGDHRIVNLLCWKANLKHVDDNGCTALHYAAMRGHSGVIASLLKAGADPLAQQTVDIGKAFQGDPPTKGNTPLFYACTKGHASAVQTLLKYDKRDIALHWAVESGRMCVLQTILDIGVNIEAIDQGHTPLCRAVLEGNAECVQILLEHGADLMASCKYGTLLHAVIRQIYNKKGRRDQLEIEAIVEVLLNGGAHINAKDAAGLTPIFYAQPSLLPYLLQHTDPFVRDENGSTLLHYADPGSVKLLLNVGININAINNNRQTALFGRDVVWSTLIDQGIDVNLRDCLGDTALLATKNENLEPIKHLVAAGVDVNARNRNGQTKLHLSNINKGCMEILVDAGADIEAPDHLGQTSLMAQARHGFYENVETLLKYGANVHAKDKLGRGVLHALLRPTDHRDWRTAANKLRILKTLVATYKEIPIDKNGNTPFHNLAQMEGGSYGCFVDQMLEILLDHYPELMPIPRDDGKTALHLAVVLPRDDIPGYQSFIEKLLPSSVDFLGRTPLHYAATTSEYYVSILLKLGVKVTPDYEQRTCLHFAARARQSSILSVLLDDDHTLIDHKDVFGRTALNDAKRSGNAESVKILAKAGAKFDGQSNFNVTDYEQESLLWRNSTLTYVGPRPLTASTVLDETRPQHYALILDGKVSPTNSAKWCSDTAGCIMPNPDEIHEAAYHGNTRIVNELRQFVNTRNEAGRTVLHEACKSPYSNFDMISLLIELGADVDARTLAEENSALHILAESKYYWQHKATRLLLEKGAGINIVNKTGETALHITLNWKYFWYEEAVEVLLEFNPNLTIISNDGLSLLDHAARRDVKIFKQMLDRTESKPNLIFSAVKGRNLEVLEVLLVAGHDVNVRDHRGWTPLAACLDCSYQESIGIAMANLLLRHGADPNLPDNEGNAPVHRFARWFSLSGFFESCNTIDYEAIDGKGCTALMIAAREPYSNAQRVEDEGWTRQQSKIKFLIQQGASPSAGNEEGPILHKFLMQKSNLWGMPLSMLKEDIECLAGSNINEKDSEGNLALHLACAQRLELVHILLKARADPHLRGRGGDTLLHALSSSQPISIEAGIDVEEESPIKFDTFYRSMMETYDLEANCINDAGETPLFGCVRSWLSSDAKYPNPLPFYKSLGTDLKHKNNDGQTLLHVVAGSSMPWWTSRKSKSIEIFKLLIDEGLDPRAEDSKGITPLDLASAADKEDILKMFRT